MADRLRKMLEVVAAELGARAADRPEWYPAPEWHICETKSRPNDVQLGHGGPGRDLWLYAREPVPRGLVIRRGEGLTWQVDDGRGLIVSGSARRPKEMFERAWPIILEHLVDPADLVMRILRRAAEREHYAQLGQPQWLGVTIGWDKLQVAPHRSPSGQPAFPYVLARFEPADIDLAFARQLVPAADLARRLSGVALDYVQQRLGIRPTRREHRPAFAAIDQVWIDSTLDWRPGAPPAALWDAGSTRRKSTPDGQWSDRLDDLLEDESPRARAVRVKAAEKRIKGGIHLPDRGDSSIDTKTGKVQRYYDKGADRVPFNVRTVAGLYLLGLGARRTSELLVGDHRAKNALNARMKEIRDGGEHWSAIDPMVLLEQMGLAEHVRPAEAPGAPPGRPKAKPAAKPAPKPQPRVTKVRVKRRQTPAEAQPEQPNIGERWAAFVGCLPDNSRRFISMLESRGMLTLSEAAEALGIGPREVGGITGSIERWAPVRSLSVPYEATFAPDGDKCWVWQGVPGVATRPQFDELVANSPEPVLKFVSGLRGSTADFLELVYDERQVSSERALDVMAMPDQARFTRSIHHRIVRWSSLSGVALPYEVLKNDAGVVTAYRWVGWHESEAA